MEGSLPFLFFPSSLPSWWVPAFHIYHTFQAILQMEKGIRERRIAEEKLFPKIKEKLFTDSSEEIQVFLLYPLFFVKWLSALLFFLPFSP